MAQAAHLKSHMGEKADVDISKIVEKIIKACTDPKIAFGQIAQLARKDYYAEQAARIITSLRP